MAQRAHAMRRDQHHSSVVPGKFGECADLAVDCPVDLFHGLAGIVRRTHGPPEMMPDAMRSCKDAEEDVPRLCCHQPTKQPAVRADALEHPCPELDSGPAARIELLAVLQRMCPEAGAKLFLEWGRAGSRVVNVVVGPPVGDTESPRHHTRKQVRHVDDTCTHAGGIEPRPERCCANLRVPGVTESSRFRVVLHVEVLSELRRVHAGGQGRPRRVGQRACGRREAPLDAVLRDSPKRWQSARRHPPRDERPFHRVETYDQLANRISSP